MHNSIIEINTHQFIANLSAIREYIQLQTIDKAAAPKICLPLKANAYGHGLVGMAKIAVPYVDYFAVARLDEGIALRRSGIQTPILVFGGFSDTQIPGLIAYNLEITVSSEYKAQLIHQYCAAHNKLCKVHIEVETGMNRMGMRSESAQKLIQWLLQQSQIKVVGIYSHLASSDEPQLDLNTEQINKFTKIAQYLRQFQPDIIAHLANSGGVCSFPKSYFDMVRPGIMCYGYPPIAIAQHSVLAKIKPCFSLKSRVIYFKVVDKNQGISYNHKYITNSQTRIVTIPIGYGDGYRRALSGTAQVIIRGQKYPIAGTVCMDMLMADIGPHDSAYINDEVVLIGRQNDQEIPIDELAQQCNTIIYEILCGFSERLPRVYT